MCISKTGSLSWRLTINNQQRSGISNFPGGWNRQNSISRAGFNPRINDRGFGRYSSSEIHRHSSSEYIRSNGKDYTRYTRNDCYRSNGRGCGRRSEFFGRFNNIGGRSGIMDSLAKISNQLSAKASSGLKSASGTNDPLIY